jgi:hypothetical protein
MHYDNKAYNFKIGYAMNDELVRVKGEGVAALKEFIWKHDPSAFKKKESNSISLSSDCSSAQEDRKQILSLHELEEATRILVKLRKNDPSIPSLKAFLTKGKGSTIDEEFLKQLLAPELVTKRESSPEQSKRRKKLLRLEEEKKYAKMVKSVQKRSDANDFQKEMSSVKQHLTIGANMIAARITAFVAVYMVSRHLFDNETTVRKRFLKLVVRLNC